MYAVYSPVVPAYAQGSVTDTQSDTSGDQSPHASPLQQQREGVPLSDIQCNAPRDLYIRDSQQPLCLYPDTYEALLALGLDLTEPVTDDAPALATLTPEEAAWLEENPTITVAYDPQWIPIEYLDESGQLAGTTAQYVSEFERITGADFAQASISSWSHALASLQDRSADIVFMSASTTERLEYMSFTEPHYTARTSIATLGDGPVDLNEEGLRLLTVRDYAIEAWLDENHPDVEYISVDGFVAGLEMMQAGEADAFAATWEVVNHHAGVLGIEGLRNAGPTGHEYDLSIGYRNDLPILGSILQKALDAIPDSVLERIQQGYDASSTLATLTPEEAAWLEENPTITVAYDPQWIPIEYLDESGQLAGTTAQYVSEFERITGADFAQASISSWSHALESLQDRSADVVFMSASTTDRLEYMSFTEPHYTARTSIATLGDGPVDLNEEGLRLLTVRDYAIEAWLDENHPDVEYISVDGFVAGLEMMQAGEADAFAATWEVVNHHAGVLGIEGLRNAGPTGHEYDLSIGYRNDLPILGSILQKALDEIPESVLAQIQQTETTE